MTEASTALKFARALESIMADNLDLSDGPITASGVVPASRHGSLVPVVGNNLALTLVSAAGLIEGTYIDLWPIGTGNTVNGVPVQDRGSIVFIVRAGAWEQKKPYSSTGGGLDAEGVRDVIAAALVPGTNVTITVNDAGDTITIASSAGGGGGGGTLWTPAALGSAVVAWFDASDYASLTLSGSDVTAWASRVGSISATVPSGKAPGSYLASGQNAKPSVQFGSSSQFTGSDATLPLGSSPSTVSIVAYVDSAASAADQFPFWQGGTSTQNGRGVGVQSGVALVSNYDTSLNASPSSWSNEVRNQIWQNSGTTSALSTDGNTATTASQPVNISASGIRIGALSAGYGQFRGELQEVIVANRVLTTSERQKLEGYSAWHWGREASLPAGHPYKSAAPTV